LSEKDALHRRTQFEEDVKESCLARTAALRRSRVQADVEEEQAEKVAE
jgi:hypothetical protein